MTAPKYITGENAVSHLPAVLLLARLGWEILSKDELNKLRDNEADVLLEPVLREQLQKRSLHWRDHNEPINDANIAHIIRRLREAAGGDEPARMVWDTLVLGVTVVQNINGVNRSINASLIDWQNPEANVFHLAPEFTVSRDNMADDAGRRPDIVLFVNGIPFVVIECKDSSIPVDEAISQMLRNQKIGEIPRLFTYAQLLLAVNKSKARYATAGTPKKLWAAWREKEIGNDEINKSECAISAEGQAKISAYFPNFTNTSPPAPVDNTATTPPSGQGTALVCLCSPKRLLDLTKNFILFDAKDKKIARWQQFFAVKDAVKHIFPKDGVHHPHKGGIIWHSQGSGKSLTMVFMARALAAQPSAKNARIVLVNDRVDLDKQIKATFEHTQMAPKRATTGTELITLIKKRTHIITTLIHKFRAAMESKTYDDSDDIFMLVDEGHRTQYGEMHTKMRRVFPNACYLCFTGTPISKKEKHTAAVFGRIISTYTTQEAIDDKAILPLLYEARIDNLSLDANIDEWFEKYTAGLAEDKQAKYKRKFSHTAVIGKAERVIAARAYDIHQHFLDNYKSTGLTAQLVAPDKKTAVKYKKALDEINNTQKEQQEVTGEVIISSPDSREGHENTESDNNNDNDNEIVQRFWQTMMDKYHNEQAYNDDIIAKYKSGDGADIIIVVNKLLTGFDAPRNACLYLTRPMEGHNLLQAIARVNRVLDEGIASKPYGLIVDYHGVLRNLEIALAENGSLDGYNDDDVRNVVIYLNDKVKELPQRYGDLLAIFNGVRVKEYDSYLADDKRRDDFYEALTAFGQSLRIALGSAQFMEKTPDKEIGRYKEALKQFIHLRKTVIIRYGDEMDSKAFERKIGKLVDTHLNAAAVSDLRAEKIDIYNDKKLAAAVEKMASKAAQADAIIHATKREINEKIKNDPAFYERFSKLLQKAIDDFRNSRLSDLDYLKTANDIRSAVVNHTDETIPPALHNNREAAAYFGIILRYADKRDNNEGEILTDTKEATVKFALYAQKIMNDSFVVNLWRNQDAQNKILLQLENYMHDELPDKGIVIPDKEKEEISGKLLEIFRHRKEQ